MVHLSLELIQLTFQTKEGIERAAIVAHYWMEQNQQCLDRFTKEG